MGLNPTAVLRALRADPTARLLIEVELPSSQRHDFERNYRSATGQAPVLGEHYHLIENKRGSEMRMYVEAAASTIQELQKHCTVTTNTGIYRDRFSYRINNNDLVRRLFREGLRLGSNDLS